MHENWQSLDIFENLMLCFPSIFRVMYTWAKAPHFLPKMQKILPKNHNQGTSLYIYLQFVQSLRQNKQSPYIKQMCSALFFVCLRTNG